MTTNEILRNANDSDDDIVLRVVTNHGETFMATVWDYDTRTVTFWVCDNAVSRRTMPVANIYSVTEVAA